MLNPFLMHNNIVEYKNIAMQTNKRAHHETHGYTA